MSRRPCGARTRHLLIESQVSYQLLQRSMIVRALPPNRTETPRASTACAAAYARRARSGTRAPVSVGNLWWTWPGSNRRLRPATPVRYLLRHKPMTSGTPESNGVSHARKSVRVGSLPRSGIGPAPYRHRARRGAGTVLPASWSTPAMSCHPLWNSQRSVPPDGPGHDAWWAGLEPAPAGFGIQCSAN